MTSCRCHSVHCSMMLRCIKMLSLHPFPFLNPACSFRNMLSIAVFILFIMILQNILLGIDSKVMPLQLLQLVRSPFFGIFTIVPSNHVLGMTLSSHIFLKSGCNFSVAVTGSDLNSSAVIWSFPGVLLFLRLLMAACISSFDGTSVHMSISSTASGMSTVVSGSGLLSTSLKCSVHLSSCSFSDVNNALQERSHSCPFHTTSSWSGILLPYPALLRQSLGKILLVLPKSLFHLLVAIRILLPKSAFQPLWLCLAYSLLQAPSLINKFPCPWCNPFFMYLPPVSQDLFTCLSICLLHSLPVVFYWPQFIRFIKVFKYPESVFQLKPEIMLLFRVS